MKLIYVLLLSLHTTSAISQSFSQELDLIYDFSPSELSDKAKSAKTPDLDRFWKKIQADTNRYLPKLRTELKAIGHKPYFYYDGSDLLLLLSGSKSDKELAILAIEKCDLNDISSEAYVKRLNGLALQGYDITKAAMKTLDVENFSFVIPQHAMNFNYSYCLTYMLVAQSDISYTNQLIAVFMDLKPASQKAIVTSLWFSYTCEGDKFLHKIMDDKAVDAGVREYAVKILGYTEITPEQVMYFNSLSNKQLTLLKTHALQSFSDEGIAELDFVTRGLRKNNNCQ